MKTAGIICECDPPHAGHGYLIDCAKRAGAEAVVCLMSGYFVQRGDAAVLEPHVRARMLLDLGANAVLELPYPYSASGAEPFAAAGISVLERLGVEEVWFGSECGSLEKLTRMAEIASRPAFGERYAALCATASVGTAAAYDACMREMCGDVPEGPNDRLAVAYLRAIRTTGAKIQPGTVKRIGNAYRDGERREGSVPSASALRRLLREQGAEATERDFKPDSYALLCGEIRAGRAPASLENAGRVCVSAFRLAQNDAMESVPELSGGLGNRLAAAARDSEDLPAMLRAAATKKYPDARMRRGILFALTGVTKDDLAAPPAYVSLLASDAAGCAFLASRRRKAGIPVVTSEAGRPTFSEAERQRELARRAAALYTVCMPKPIAEAELLRRSPFIRTAEKPGSNGPDGEGEKP